MSNPEFGLEMINNIKEEEMDPSFFCEDEFNNKLKNNPEKENVFPEFIHPFNADDNDNDFNLSLEVDSFIDKESSASASSFSSECFPMRNKTVLLTNEMLNRNRMFTKASAPGMSDGENCFKTPNPPRPVNLFQSVNNVFGNNSFDFQHKNYAHDDIFNKCSQPESDIVNKYSQSESENFTEVSDNSEQIPFQGQIPKQGFFDRTNEESFSSDLFQSFAGSHFASAKSLNPPLNSNTSNKFIPNFKFRNQNENNKTKVYKKTDSPSQLVDDSSHDCETVNSKHIPNINLKQQISGSDTNSLRLNELEKAYINNQVKAGYNEENNTSVSKPQFMKPSFKPVFKKPKKNNENKKTNKSVVPDQVVERAKLVCNNKSEDLEHYNSNNKSDVDTSDLEHYNSSSDIKMEYEIFSSSQEEGNTESSSEDRGYSTVKFPVPSFSDSDINSKHITGQDGEKGKGRKKSIVKQKESIKEINILNQDSDVQKQSTGGASKGKIQKRKESKKIRSFEHYIKVFKEKYPQLYERSKSIKKKVEKKQDKSLKKSNKVNTTSDVDRVTSDSHETLNSFPKQDKSLKKSNKVNTTNDVDRVTCDKHETVNSFSLSDDSVADIDGIKMEEFYDLSNEIDKIKEDTDNDLNQAETIESVISHITNEPMTDDYNDEDKPNINSELNLECDKPTSVETLEEKDETLVETSGENTTKDTDSIISEISAEHNQKKSLYVNKINATRKRNFQGRDKSNIVHKKKRLNENRKMSALKYKRSTKNMTSEKSIMNSASEKSTMNRASKKSTMNINSQTLKSKSVKRIEYKQIDSIKKRLFELQEMTNYPVWVQCDICGKWRCLRDVIDPASLPKNWTCSMNSDDDFSSCSSPEEEYDQEEHDKSFTFNKFTLGSVVWVTCYGPEWWPAMVDDDPDCETFFWLPETSDVPNYYHVTFLGPDVTRAWIKTSSIVPFDGRQMKMKSQMPKPKRALKIAIEEAKEAVTLSMQERRRAYCFASRYKGKWFESQNQLQEFH